ncbi:TIGR01777 family oxidoreductase [Adhaeribacter pallidiroseus]|uniref:Epimerase family protein YfcH n=1 Tax=Adhaeribacter pallidiroseus TaxID=2072847 RepID=A0A369QL38_9BACT|nr:TIGR01777 family oxidoreductase [Adhaeribacter pallidiroseus]RDC64365.1 Epimerase family protein YfcH [Adhaeribacter pallidiroseus]
MAGKILITGGTGLIGTRLSEMLIDLGYEVAHLSRNNGKQSHYQTFKWDIENNYIEEKALTYTDYIINLAGAGVADGKWTDKRKHEIRDSRVHGTNLLIEQLKKTSHHVKGFISASAVGIYGNSGERLVAEESSSAENDFLADVCRDWETAANQARNLNIRTVIFRIGIVLSKEGGALPQLAKPIKLMVGAPLGSGRQYISWIHLDDMCRLLIAALEDHQFQGVYNAVAPHPVTNEEFTHQLAEVLHKPLTGLKVPAFGLKLMLGEMSETVLGGSRVSANKVLQTGFTYEYNYLEEALESFYVKEA